jgi:hypothetical protein
MTEAAPPIYPPIARAAHVSGNVILMVSFEADGSPGHIDVLSGPVMLRNATTEYVKGWRANRYTGPRTCPIVVNYFIAPEGTPLEHLAQREDVQHVSVSTVFLPGLTIIDIAGKPVRNWRWWWHRVKRIFK